MQRAWGPKDFSCLTLHGLKGQPREKLRGEHLPTVSLKPAGRRLRESALTALTARALLFTHL